LPRYPRLFVPDIPLHIVQRGHDRKPVFVETTDYRYYLDNLSEVTNELAISVLGYCLMTNHVHLVLLPGDQAGTISKLMRVLAARQTRRVNKLESRSGTLWEGRFKASLIDSDNYLLACCRYVDLNPVRATLVTAPGDYAWSGYRRRAGLTSDSVLADHSTFDTLGTTASQRASAYRRFVERGVGEDELALIRQAVQRNQLTGGAKFKTEIEGRMGRRVSTKSQGRPRTQVQK
jgi:putative transposase